jgi:hypothetical protein
MKVVASRRIVLLSSDSSSNSSAEDPLVFKCQMKQSTAIERRTAVTKGCSDKYLLSANDHEMTKTGIWDPTSYVGEWFRRHFWVPYSLFLEIIAEYSEHVTTQAGRPWECFYDLHLLILGALRVLGSGVSFDLIQELNEISKEMNQVFFHKFIAWGHGESS